jgi:S-adenosylmethionine/arginine decarboxylase-like enzyme
MIRWGFHLALDIGKCKPLTIRCPKHIESFTKQLVKDIDMKAYGEPQIIMFGEGNKKGYTLVQLIETSNITAHFCEETNDCYLDVFSCKPFEKDDVKKCVQNYFSPESIKEHYLERLA